MKRLVFAVLLFLTLTPDNLKAQSGDLKPYWSGISFGPTGNWIYNYVSTFNSYTEFTVNWYLVDKSNTSKKYLIASWIEQTNGACECEIYGGSNAFDYSDIPFGDYNYAVEIDPENEIAETDETNNFKILTNTKTIGTTTSVIEITELESIKIISPFQEKLVFNIMLNSPTNVHYTVYSMDGKILKNASARGFGNKVNTFETDLSTLPKGIYLLKVVVGNNYITRKVVKGY